MKLELIKTEIESNFTLMKIRNQSRFDFMKNMIKKDLEVVQWQSKAASVLGEFQIYSDYKSELNSFDYIVAFLTIQNVEFVNDSIEAHISNKCPEHFLNLLITHNYKFENTEIEILSSKYTNYILEATDLINNQTNETIQIQSLDTKYFGDDDPTAFRKYLNPQYLN